MYNEPKVIAAAGDWHGNTAYGKKALYYAHQNEADTVIHTGDFGFNFTRNFLDMLNADLELYNMWLYFIDGNHENFPVLYTYPLDEYGTRPLRSRIIHLPRGFRWNWWNKEFLALGGAISVDKHHRREGRTWWRDEEITWKQADLVMSRGRADIMITHDCPDGVDIPGLEDGHLYFPEAALRASDGHRRMLRVIVDEVKPELLFHGHYHKRYNGRLEADDYTTKVIGLDCDTESVLRNLYFIEEQNDNKTNSGPEI